MTFGKHFPEVNSDPINPVLTEIRWKVEKSQLENPCMFGDCSMPGDNILPGAKPQKLNQFFLVVRSCW